MGQPIKRYFVNYIFTADTSVLLTDMGIPQVNAGYEITNRTTDYTMIDREAEARPYLSGQLDSLRRQAKDETFDIEGDKMSGVTDDIVTGEYWK